MWMVLPNIDLNKAYKQIQVQNFSQTTEFMHYNLFHGSIFMMKKSILRVDLAISQHSSSQTDICIPNCKKNLTWKRILKLLTML